MKLISLGEPVLRFDVLPSTNDKGMELLRDGGYPEGTIILAREQTKGKGQRGNSWKSFSGKDLTFSLLLFPSTVPVEEQFDLSRIMALALVDTIEEEYPQLKDQNTIRIKWPNDILIDGYKVAGILIESNLQRGRIGGAVLGAGLNVLETLEVRSENAVSLEGMTGIARDPQELLFPICAKLEKWYLELISNGPVGVRKEYDHRSFRMNEWGGFSSNEGKFKGRIIGVEPNGEISIEKETGEVEKYGIKQIRFLI